MTEKDQITTADDSTRPEWVQLILRGRIAVSSASRLRETALAISAREKHVSVCCAEIEHLDVAAIQILLCLGRALAGLGKQCDVANVPDAIRELFRLAGLGNAS